MIIVLCGLAVDFGGLAVGLRDISNGPSSPATCALGLVAGLRLGTQAQERPGLLAVVVPLLFAVDRAAQIICKSIIPAENPTNSFTSEVLIFH